MTEAAVTTGLRSEYRAGEGRLARFAAKWTVTALAAYGCWRLYLTSAGWSPWFGRSLTGADIPVVGIPLSPAAILALVVFVGSLLGVSRFLARPKSADLLIGAEEELRRVSWPTWPETVNASLVVMVVVGALGLVLAGMDWVLGRFFDFVLFGG